MAKQKGIIKLDGTIGDITFLKTSDGYTAKEKSEVKKSLILSGDQYQRTRENMAEFGRAGSAGKMLRTAFSSFGHKGDKRMTSRLTRVMMQVLKADTLNDRGQRTVVAGDLLLLTGFDFNGNAHLTSTFKTPYSATIDRAGGSCKIEVPSFVPKNVVSGPVGSTHFRIIAGAVALNFIDGQHSVDKKETAYLPWDNTPTAPVSLEMALPAGSADPLFLALGIEFTQEINGKQYTLNNGAFNVLTLVRVEA